MRAEVASNDCLKAERRITGSFPSSPSLGSLSGITLHLVGRRAHGSFSTARQAGTAHDRVACVRHFCADRLAFDRKARCPMSASDTQAQFELGEQTRLAFLRGLTIEEAIADLTLPAMSLGIEPDESARLIREFFETCAKRETPADTIARLASLDRPHYETLRKSEAERLGWRVSVLEAEVVAAREKRAGGGAAGDAQSNPLITPDPEPWPEPVEGAALLNEMATLFSTYITAPREVIDAAALSDRLRPRLCTGRVACSDSAGAYVRNEKVR